MAEHFQQIEDYIGKFSLCIKPEVPPNTDMSALEKQLKVNE